MFAANVVFKLSLLSQNCVERRSQGIEKFPPVRQTNINFHRVQNKRWPPVECENDPLFPRFSPTEVTAVTGYLGVDVTFMPSTCCKTNALLCFCHFRARATTNRVYYEITPKFLRCGHNVIAQLDARVFRYFCTSSSSQTPQWNMAAAVTQWTMNNLVLHYTSTYSNRPPSKFWLTIKGVFHL